MKTFPVWNRDMTIIESIKTYGGILATEWNSARYRLKLHMVWN